MPRTIYKDADQLSEGVAEWIVDYIHKTLQLQDRFTIALSGGSTPKKLHMALASQPIKNRIDWQRVHVFWGDERYVPFSDERNNAKMAFDTLLNRVPVPSSQIFIMQTDIDFEQSAKNYELILEEYFPTAAAHKKHPIVKPAAAPFQQSSPPQTFNLVLLGLGDNAHTLSLFPEEKVIHEQERWVCSVFVEEVNMERITLTPPVVNLASRIAFLVSGKEKAEAVAQVLSNDYDPDHYPAQIIKPERGELFWFLDEAAAIKLNE